MRPERGVKVAKAIYAPMQQEAHKPLTKFLSCSGTRTSQTRTSLNPSFLLLAPSLSADTASYTILDRKTKRRYFCVSNG